MALTVTMTQVTNPCVANRTNFFTVTVANTNATSATLTSLFISESTESDAQIAQPVYLTPNTPVGVGNPVIPAGSSASYMFTVIFSNPMSSGPSPQNPGGAAPASNAMTPDPFFMLQAAAQASDGTIFSSQLQVPVLSVIQNSPIPQGGALQQQAGSSLINFLTL